MVYKLLLMHAKLIWNAMEREIKLRSANSIFYHLYKTDLIVFYFDYSVYH